MTIQQVLLKRGTTSKLNSYVGQIGEVVVNTDTKRLHVMDGSTSGGTKTASTSLTDDGVKVLGNVDWNTVLQPGFYHCNSTGATNGPGYAAKVVVLAEKVDDQSAKYLTQVAFPIYNAKQRNFKPAFRNKSNETDTWSDWVPFVLDDQPREIKITSQSVTKGITPTNVDWSMIKFQDNNTGGEESARLGLVGTRVGNDGSIRSVLAAYKPESGSTSNTSLYVGYDSNGSIVTYAPKPAKGSNNNNIATTSWIEERLDTIDGGVL